MWPLAVRGGVRLDPERRSRGTLEGLHKRKRQCPTVDVTNEGVKRRPKRKITRSEEQSSRLEPERQARGTLGGPDKRKRQSLTGEPRNHGEWGPEAKAEAVGMR